MKAVKTILFVENDPVSLTMYQNRLQREGFYIETAQDGLTALRILSQSTPDLVVLDLMLPRFNGTEVFKIMRTDKRLINLPVVIFSNAAVTEWPQDLNIGPTRCLAKSDSTFPMLLQTIQEMLADSPVNNTPIVRTDNLPPIKPETAGRPGQPAPNTESTPAAAAAPVPKGRADFLQSALAEIPKLRELCLAYIKAPAADASQQYLSTLQQRVLHFHTSASQHGCGRLAQLSNVFGTLLSEILAKPSWATTSVLQTMAQAVDCLRFLLNSGESFVAQTTAKAKVLAVDDDPVCNHVIVTTLRRANFDPMTIESAVAALDLLQNNQYDLVLLDVNMPEMTGFQLCEKLRRIPHCKTIPVVFVTAFNNFDNRKQSVLSGGNDFITKPISPLELALKVTIHMLKAQAQRAVAPSVDVGADTPDIAKNSPPPLRPAPITQTASSRNGMVEDLKDQLQSATQSRSSEAEAILATAPPLPGDSPAPLPPSAPVPMSEPERIEMSNTVPESALQSTTESHTSDVEPATTPETAPSPFEPAPVHASTEPEDAFQPSAAIAAPQLDQALVASLAPSSLFATAPDATAEHFADANSPASPPSEPSQSDSQENMFPAAGIPTDMFDRNPGRDVVPASALTAPTESGSTDSQTVAAPDPTASQPASPDVPQHAFQPESALQTSVGEQNTAEEPPAAPFAKFPTPEWTPAVAENAVASVETSSTAEPAPAPAQEATAKSTEVAPQSDVSATRSAESPAPSADASAQSTETAAHSVEFKTESADFTAAVANLAAALAETTAPASDTVTESRDSSAHPADSTVQSAESKPADAAPKSQIEPSAPAEIPASANLSEPAKTDTEAAISAEIVAALNAEIAAVLNPQSSQPEPAAVTSPETALQSTASTPATSTESATSEKAPVENASPVETPAASTTEPKAAVVETASTTAESPAPKPVPAEPAKAAVQLDFISPIQSVAPLSSSAPAVSDIQKSPMQKQNDQAAFDKIVLEVAKLMFGDNNLTDLNLRLVRAALERSNVHQLLKGPTDLSC